MGIEKEAPKNYFRNVQHKGLVNIMFTSSWIVDHMKHILEPYDLTPQQYNILRILQSSPRPMSTVQVKARMIDRMSDTSRIVERLIVKGLSHKQASRKDKRLVDITITPKGIELLEKLENESSRIDSIISNLQPAEIDSLNNLLDKMRMDIPQD